MKKNKIIAIIAITIFIILLVIVGLCLQKLNSQILEEQTLYQYFLGHKTKYEGKMRFSRKNGITYIETENEEIELDSTPLYYENIENKMILPEDMEVVFPTQPGEMYKINHFSKIKCDEDTVYYEKGDDNKSLGKSFLYDGQDLYIFVNQTTLQIGEEKYDLTPLSYVICGQDSIEIYQKNEDKCTVIEEKPVNVQAYTNEYKINLNTDSIQGGKSEQLLLKKIKELKNF